METFQNLFQNIEINISFAATFYVSTFIVFPGVGGSADSWQNQLTFFSALGYEVIAPDLLGHGFSSTPDRPKAYTFTKLFRDTLTIFDHFCVSGGRQNPCVVIGHSYGGSIATALARSRPEQIKVLVRRNIIQELFQVIFRLNKTVGGCACITASF